MSVSFSQLRVAVASQVDAISGFTQSRIPPEYFGRQENSVAHKRFAVQLSASQDQGERMRRAVGVYCTTNVRVIFAYRLRPKDAYPTDYDAGLDSEKDVINAVLSTYNAIQPEVVIRYNRSVRNVSDSTEYMLFNLEFTALHTLPTT
jgi:hypothetical protein